ncbi:MAG: hypothetical protein ACSHYC_09745 [Alphaproteobacteria bacterium]
MDLVDTLRSKIAVIDDGDHMSGLQATLGHIEVSFRHLARGQKDGDETAFTDAIYRTNQAFEGSIKEAYRVLAGKDPQRKTPFKIEEYLETNSVFRERVLNQFRNYRTQWRNPAAHDYKLDFDESEAFLAIISVTAFACLLSDQIAEKIAFNASKTAAESSKPSSSNAAKSASLYDQAAALIQHSVSAGLLVPPLGTMTESILIGTLSGMFASAYPEIVVNQEVVLAPEAKYRADMMLSKRDEKLIIELKRYSRERSFLSGRDQVERYLEVSGLTNALLVYVPQKLEQAELIQYIPDHSKIKIGIILPKSAIMPAT